MRKVFDHMSYLPDMEQIDSPVMDEVLSAVRAYDYNQYTAQDVRAALSQRVIDPAAFAVLLSPAAQPCPAGCPCSAGLPPGRSRYAQTPIYQNKTHCKTTVYAIHTHLRKIPTSL